jgi:RimJ/RimL family protein N-acetyltransferase
MTNQPSHPHYQGMIESLRLQLRPWSPEHLLALIQGTEQFHQASGLRAAEGLREFVVSDEISDSWFEQLRTATSADPWVFGFAVVDRECGLVIGSAGFKGAPDDDGMVEIGYGIVPAFEGKGYATEAASALISFASSDPRVRIIRAHTLAEPNASTRVLAKNDFAKVGEVVDPEDGLVWRWERLGNSSVDERQGL